MLHLSCHKKTLRKITKFTISSFLSVLFGYELDFLLLFLILFLGKGVGFPQKDDGRSQEKGYAKLCAPHDGREDEVLRN